MGRLFFLVFAFLGPFFGFLCQLGLFFFPVGPWSGLFFSFFFFSLGLWLCSLLVRGLCMGLVFSRVLLVFYRPPHV